MSSEVIVAGGGIAGTTIAWELARRGGQVTAKRYTEAFTEKALAAFFRPLFR